ncbi:Splicing factor [Ciborinia camelliae]|nr:Splicing factor [Ciborinia camelliae]
MGEPVGEDEWLALVDEASRNARDLDQRIEVVELYKRAISAEPWSNPLWLARCDWVLSLYTDCRDPDAGWPEDEQQLGQELFTLQTAQNLWQEGAAATQFRLNDSHELWNRWITFELELVARSPTREGISGVRQKFLDRLQTPHAKWYETSQMFSTFITKYDESSWESTMVQVTQMGSAAKYLYEQREERELKLQQAVAAGDKEGAASIMKEYLEWESLQPLKKPKKGLPHSPQILTVALYERALASTILGRDPGTWEDYIAFVQQSYAVNPDAQLGNPIYIAQRATAHCPWSGSLWARYILLAETQNLDFSTIEDIKHAATSTGVLDREGKMDEVIEVYIAWCGYLRRRTIHKSPEDEAFDMADVGLSGSLETVLDWGRRLHKREYTGDPSFRIERILIQYLTQKGSVEEARGFWRSLVNTHQRSYAFWQQYYFWEMTVQNPNSSTKLPSMVLSQAIRTKDLDWPEAIMEMYIAHCNNYEDAHTLLAAKDLVRRQFQLVVKRREKLAAEQAELYAQQQPQVITPDPTVEESPGNSKRKREATSEDVDGNTHKKIKNEQPVADPEALRQQHLTRDRENTTVIVTNLPPEVTQTKVRQYFKEYGHINSLTLKREADKLSSTCLIEFRSNEDVQSSFLRDGKFFGENQIKVETGTGLTLYVTNYPPAADENYMHKLFKDCGEIFSIRWPSLKFNTHRRFCYITFRKAEAASAATQLDGKFLENKFKLVAKYSDPAGKKQREGATAEGRELHITSLDSSLKEDDLKEVFAKYGQVETVRILRTTNGESKGAGFIVFEKKDEATAALELDKTKLKSSVLHVELTQARNYKPIATSREKGTPVSPAPDADGDSAMSPTSTTGYPHNNQHALHQPSKPESSNRTVTLLNVPDTVNDARIRAIAEPFGNITKVVLRPDHQGAIIEYEDVASAGKAALSLENHEIAPGRKLRTGGMKDLFAHSSEIKSDRIVIGQNGKKDKEKGGTRTTNTSTSTFMQPSAPIRRPGGGGRGGLGQKRGLGFSAAKKVRADSDAKPSTASSEDHTAKSNADFKKMFLSAGKE